MITLDNYSLYEWYQLEQDKQLSKLPVCEYCGEPIQDDFYFHIDGETLCSECLNEHFRKRVEDYVR